MLETFKNAWKIKEIRQKILFTLLILFLYRVGSTILPVAGIDASKVAEQVQKNDILSFINMITGGSLANYTIFAVGISPYITASIVVNLLTFAIPALERIAKDGGDEGREKIQNITRYVGIGLAALMGASTLTIVGGSLYKQDLLSYITVVLSLTAGTALVMWLADLISAQGIGNGTSMIIFIGIISQLPIQIIQIMNAVGQGVSVWILVPILAFYVIMIAGVVFIDRAERRIPVQYAKKVVGRKQYGGQSTHIPMKLNASGVMPIIFASTLLQIPSFIVAFWPDSGIANFFGNYNGSAVYMILFGILVLAFSFFYNTIQFNPIEMSKNIQQYGGFIPGIRPGKPTSDFLSRISTRLTFFGGLFLAVLATVPPLVAKAMNISMALSATGILIAVSVSLETSKQIESLMLMRHYKGFLK